MISLLARRLIPHYRDYHLREVRQRYGILCSIVGIVCNLLLCAGKFLCGSLSASIAITADALNSLSDAGSSLVTLLGFRLSAKPSDPQHPFGHGRLEYISGLIVSFLILLMAFELGSAALQKILHPTPATFHSWSIGILAASVLLKLYIALYNRTYGRRIHSAALNATATDSFTDSIATLVVLLSMVVGHVWDLAVDGWCGLLLSLFVAHAGIRAARDTIAPLLGQRPDPEFVQQVQALVLAHEGVCGLHDLVVHDYGPGRRMLSLHVEVDSNSNMLQAHDMVDNIERELRHTLQCDAVLHTDPIVTDDVATTEMRTHLQQLLQGYDATLTMHDFRMVTGPTHTNLVFDVVVPFHHHKSDAQIIRDLQQQIEAMGSYYAVIEIDRPLV